MPPETSAIEAFHRVNELLESIRIHAESDLSDDMKESDIYDFLIKFQERVALLPERLSRRVKQGDSDLQGNVTLFVKRLQTTTNIIQEKMKKTCFRKPRVATVDLIAFEKGIENALSEFMMREIFESDAPPSQEAQLSNARLSNSTLAGFNYEEHKHRCGEIDDHSIILGIFDDVWGKVLTWVMNASNHKSRIFWLNDADGLGMSALLKLIAANAGESSEFYGASVFFGRDVTNYPVTDPKLVFPTLMLDLACHDDKYAREVLKVVKKRSYAATDDFKKQFEQLIRIPFERSRTSFWRLTNGRAPALMIIDALDECDSETAMQDILDAIFSLTKSMRGDLLFLLASRSEANMRSAFEKHGKEEYESLSIFDVHVTFLRKYILGITGDMGVSLSEGWPREEDLALLINKYGCTGIVTALRFICDGNIRDPERHLRVLLALIDDHPEAAVQTRADSRVTPDALYLGILEYTMLRYPNENDINQLHQFLAMVVVLCIPVVRDFHAHYTRNYSFSDFSALLGLREEEVRGILRRLQSFIVIPVTFVEYAPRFLESSFREFIMDPQKCRDARLLVDVKEEEHRMLLRCFETMEGALRRRMVDTSNTKWPATMVTYEIQGDMPERIDEAFTPVLAYAVENWAKLLKTTSPGDIPAVLPLFLEFVEQKLLCWLESLSWIGRLRYGLLDLQEVIDWMVEHNLSEEVRGKLIDAHQVVHQNLHRMKLNAFLVYDLFGPPMALQR